MRSNHCSKKWICASFSILFHKFTSKQKHEDDILKNSEQVFNIPDSSVFASAYFGLALCAKRFDGNAENVYLRTFRI